VLPDDFSQGPFQRALAFFFKRRLPWGFLGGIDVVEGKLQQGGRAFPELGGCPERGGNALLLCGACKNDGGAKRRPMSKPDPLRDDFSDFRRFGC